MKTIITIKLFIIILLISSHNIFAQQTANLVSPNVLDNDDCANARNYGPIRLNESVVFTENNGSAATNNGGFMNTCSNGMNDGEWFRFIGSGERLKIELTGVQANYDPQLAVYSGSCNNLGCIATVDNGNNGGNETIIFTTEYDVVYYINVGYFSNIIDSPEGNFTLNIIKILGNDSCATAVVIPDIDLFPYTEYSGNQATNNGGFVSAGCGTANDGEWFTFVGTGYNMFIQLNDVQVGYDPKVVVYSGDCTNLICQASVDSGFSGQGEALLVQTVVGTIYYINIANFSATVDGPEGNFSLYIYKRLTNDNCTTAKNVTSYPFDFSENRGRLSTVTNIASNCFAPYYDGVWFKLTGDGAQKSISVTEVANFFDTKISIFNGSCSNLICLYDINNSGVGGSENTNFSSILGEIYYINIGNVLEYIGVDNFRIQITSSALASKNFDFKNLKVYPNPVTNILKIENSEKIDSISISNLLGQELINQKDNGLKSEIDLATFEPGGYLVKINSENKEQVFKILKN